MKDQERPRFQLSVRRAFRARHYLTVPGAGEEGVAHAHEYVLELEFAGPTLDEFGYLVDIDDVEARLDDIVAIYGDSLLNDRPEFGDKNPSVERFARVLADRIGEDLEGTVASELTVRVWEDEHAWASYRREIA